MATNATQGLVEGIDFSQPMVNIARKKIFTILKPGGKLVIGFGDKEQLEKKDLSSDVFNLYASDDVKDILN